MADRKEIKLKRFEAVYRETIQEAILTKIGDHRIVGKIITVTRAKVSDDMAYADVYVTALQAKKKTEILKALSSASVFFLTLLQKKVKVRYLPSIRFKWDDMYAEADELVGLIEKLKRTGGRKPSSEES